MFFIANTTKTPLCQRCTQINVMALIKCNECGQMVSDKATTCPNCGVAISQSVSEKSTPKLRIVRVGSTPIVSVTLEVKADGQTIGIYPFNVGFDMEIPVSSNMELLVKCQGMSTPMVLTLDPNENYTCKISYSTSFSYELYGSNGVLLKKDKLGIGMWILSFLIPLVGIIYYFVKKDEYPAKSKSALMAALIGFAVSIFAVRLYKYGINSL